MGNKTDEINCMNMAISILHCQDEFDQSVAKMLSGIDVMRKQNERPDFVRLSQNDTNNKIILGVEHFRVDHLSKKNAKKQNVIQATNMTNEKRLKRFIKEKSDCSDFGLNNEKNVQGFLDLVAAQSGRQIEAQYNDYITAFEYSLSNHLSNAEVYKKTLTELAANDHCFAKLAFLIEIHTGFHRLFFNDETGSKFINAVDQCIFFEDIVTLLESIDSSTVDYVIMCFGSVVYGDDIKVISLKTGEIRKHLYEKGIKIYKYYGEDFNIAAYNHLINNVKMHTIVSTDANGELQCRISQSSQKIQKEGMKAFIENASYYALQAQNEHKNFITTTRVQYVLDVYAPYITEWIITPKGLYGCVVNIPESERNKVARRIEVFKQKILIDSDY